MEAVRQAIAELGSDTMPVTLQEFVKKKFGLTMSTAHVSNYKTYILRKSPAKAAKVAAKPVVAAKTFEKPATVAPAATPKPVPHLEGISLPDIETVKDLVGRVNGSDLKGLIELFSK
jgi:hypothetical protein